MSDAGSRAAPTGIPEITIGTHITNYGVYDITVSDMASGGMGLVAWGPNRARNNHIQAVKLPRPDRLAAADPQRRAAIVADFEREALTWCHLWYHPCIVAAEGLLQLHGLNGLPAIFLEYAPEGSLRARLQHVHVLGSNSALGLRAVFAWGQMIAAALATIHQPEPDLDRPDPLVHCDLKPENVLLSAKGWAMLTDLGLTRALASLADTAPQPPALAGSENASSGSGEMIALSMEQQEQVAQVRRLLTQAGVVLPDTSAMPDEALYATRTICVSPAQQAALISQLKAAEAGSGAAMSAGMNQPIQHITPATPAMPASATQMIEQMGSRGLVAGTPPYMPPEQWLGLDAVEPASDVYALGVMLFELFAGVGGRAAYPHTPDPLLLLTAGPFAAWCAAHNHGPSRRLGNAEVAALSHGPLVALVESGRQAQAAVVLAGLEELIARCLAFSPAARPTAKQVQDQLAALAAEAGLDPLAIPEYTRTPETEAMFWENLGIVYGEIGQPEKRLPLQRRAIALTPESPKSLEALAIALRRSAAAQQQAAREATAAGQHALARELQTQARAYLEEAIHNYQLAEGRLTAEWLERYAYLANSIPYNLGAALNDLERYAEAVAARQRALAVDPDDAMSYHGLAVTYLRWADETGSAPVARVERLQQAEIHARRLLDIAPHFEGGQSLLATIQRELAAARHNRA